MSPIDIVTENLSLPLSKGLSSLTRSGSASLMKSVKCKNDIKFSAVFRLLGVMADFLYGGKNDIFQFDNL